MEEHLRLDNPLKLVICPVTHQVENTFVYLGDEDPAEDFCEGCKRMVDL